MKITESKLRQMIRGVIREFTSSATVAGAKKGGYKSADTRSKESDYTAKKADYDTKKTDADTKVSDREAVDHQKYRIAVKGGGYNYKATATRGDGYSLNPDWSTKAIAATGAERDRDEAERAKDAAETTRDTARASDLEKTVPTQKPPTGGGAGFGKGKSAGKGKGKKKK